MPRVEEEAGLGRNYGRRNLEGDGLHRIGPARPELRERFGRRRSTPIARQLTGLHDARPKGVGHIDRERYEIVGAEGRSRLTQNSRSARDNVPDV